MKGPLKAPPPANGRPLDEGKNKGVMKPVPLTEGDKGGGSSTAAGIG